MDDSITRKEEILQAALDVFTREGYSGARLKTVAENIGVTKAMIHYYFGTKENLFREAYQLTCETLLRDLFGSLEEDTTLFQKIEQFVDDVLNRFERNPQRAQFLINELNQHPDITKEIFQESHQGDLSALNRQLKEAADNYEIAPVTGDQLVANIISLCVFSCTGRDFLRALLQQDDEANRTFQKKRRETIKDMIINWLAG